MVDILWVQDTSGSMVGEVENIKKEFRNFINQIKDRRGDYRIAFITMRWNSAAYNRDSSRLEFLYYNRDSSPPPFSLLRRSNFFSLIRGSIGEASWCFSVNFDCNESEIFTLTNQNDLNSFFDSLKNSNPLIHPPSTQNGEYINDQPTERGLSFYGLEAVEYFLEDHNRWFRNEAKKHAIIVSDDNNISNDKNDSNRIFSREPSGSLEASLHGNITIHSIVRTNGTRYIVCPDGVRRGDPEENMEYVSVGQNYIDFSNGTGGTVSDIRCRFGNSLSRIARRVTRRSFPLSLKAIEESSCTSQVNQNEISCSISEEGCTVFFESSDLEGLRGDTITANYHSSGDQCEIEIE